MGMTPILSGFASNDLASKDQPQRIAAAAREFEAVLIEQMLKETRSGSGLGDEQDQAGSALREMADQQFARVIAGQGGLGITKVLVQSLNQASPQIPASSQIPAPPST